MSYNNVYAGGGNKGGRYESQSTRTAFSIYEEDFDYVGKAKEVIKELVKNKGILTTSKIRRLLAMLNEIYTTARHEPSDKLSTEIRSQIQYFKLHFVYEAGREKSVKNFLEYAQIIEQADAIGDEKNKLIRFCHYMEALVAYRKFLGGKDE